MLVLGVAARRASSPRSFSHLLEHPMPYAYALKVFKTLKHETFGEGKHRNVQEDEDHFAVTDGVREEYLGDFTGGFEDQYSGNVWE
jgi:hypothetical protein